MITVDCRERDAIRLTSLLVVLLSFGTAAAAQQQQPIFTPLNATGIYRVNERAGWTATLPPGTTPPANGYTYVITRNGKDTIRTGVLDFTSGTATLDARVGEPAMMYARVKTGEAGPRGHINLGAAVAPLDIKPVIPRPKDFDDFWNAKLRELAKVPMVAELTTTATTVPNVELFTIKISSLGSTAQGYLAKPAGPGKFPALVIFQYAGVYPLQQQWSTSRAAEGWLTLNVDSHDVAPDQTTGVPQNYRAVGDTSRETSYFLNMYLRDTRAIDYLATRPEWDGRVMVVTGTSMGGQQSLVAAGLNPKVTAVIVNEPSGADANAELHGRSAGYPNWQWSSPRVMETGRYFDTINFASRIKAPVCIAVGFIDVTAVPVGIITAFNEIRAPKELIPMIDSDHNHITPQKQGAWNVRSKELLDLLRAGGAFLPRRLVQ